MDATQTSRALGMITGVSPDDDAEMAVQLLLDYVETQVDGDIVAAAYRDAESRIARARNA